MSEAKVHFRPMSELLAEPGERDVIVFSRTGFWTAAHYNDGSLHADVDGETVRTISPADFVCWLDAKALSTIAVDQFPSLIDAGVLDEV